MGMWGTAKTTSKRTVNSFLFVSTKKGSRREIALQKMKNQENIFTKVHLNS